MSKAGQGDGRRIFPWAYSRSGSKSWIIKAPRPPYAPFAPILRSMGYTEPNDGGKSNVAAPAKKIWILHQSPGDDRHRLWGGHRYGAFLFPAVCACDRRCTYDLYGLRLLPVTPREGGSYENCRGQKPKVPRWYFADDLQN